MVMALSQNRLVLKFNTNIEFIFDIKVLSYI